MPQYIVDSLMGGSAISLDDPTMREILAILTTSVVPPIVDPLHV